ncbi:hypothetical protein Hydth_1039 [Hydrogenobacter thermophilus TK-6]|uniref:HPt domain-containing protein n=1 Tax=Hydrogenobacter thermophilus (strain DSM 6534 / IAM 12695 / TK-6) TaxID=608538 RepID=D3DI51_HYDTT|nr:hypothetical protein [Hydrogenobacter thermophilus]ADO45432.1 hypothetical protein Hydth_1039 [Hydrogenobacter thermophilus TK-6]BAI69503.1 hypothetical protein HTH_1045 [Hydrogenobacter thermophilus TK-6]
MSKEFEIGLSLIRKVMPELEALLNAQDKLSARKMVNALFHPITASAYQIRVGSGPRKDELLKVLTPLVSQMRELSDLEALKESVRKLLEVLKDIEEELSATQEQKNV